MGKFSLTMCPDEGCACPLSDHNGYKETPDGHIIPHCDVCEGFCDAAQDTVFARKVRTKVDSKVPWTP